MVRVRFIVVFPRLSFHTRIAVFVEYVEDQQSEAIFLLWARGRAGYKNGLTPYDRGTTNKLLQPFSGRFGLFNFTTTIKLRRLRTGFTVFHNDFNGIDGKYGLIEGKFLCALVRHHITLATCLVLCAES